MNRAEKNLLTKQKIIQSALAEFGERSYEQAAMNNICKNNEISKGIIYHYFKNKDELYLVCVQECFDLLTSYLINTGCEDIGELEQALQCYFDTRISFFSQNPYYFKIFCDVITNPPGHLKTAITEIKKDFDEMNVRMLTKLFSRITLRNGISTEEAVSNFFRLQNFFNMEYQKEFEEYPDKTELPKLHEEKRKKFVDMLLYGLVQKG